MSQAVGSRRLLVVAGALLAVAGIVLGWQLWSAGLPRWPLYDFVSFWAAGRLNAQGVGTRTTRKAVDGPGAHGGTGRPAGAGDVASRGLLTLLGPLARLDAHAA